LNKKKIYFEPTALNAIYQQTRPVGQMVGPMRSNVNCATANGILTASGRTGQAGPTDARERNTKIIFFVCTFSIQKNIFVH
jgi:hypothetical protein